MSEGENPILQNGLPSSEQRNPAPSPTPKHSTARRRRGGPATPQGSAHNWRSALAHGITSNAPVIPHIEDEIKWRCHLEGVRASLAPEGHLEHALAERVANLLWRLNRVTRYEVVVTMRHIGSTAYDLAMAERHLAPRKEVVRAAGAETIAAHQQARILPASQDLDKIMRYETHLHRQCIQALHELEALQARRRGEPTHLARLDISATPA